MFRFEHGQLLLPDEQRGAAACQNGEALQCQSKLKTTNGEKTAESLQWNENMGTFTQCIGILSLSLCLSLSVCLSLPPSLSLSLGEGGGGY